jgi:hypothetical protein
MTEDDVPHNHPSGSIRHLIYGRSPRKYFQRTRVEALCAAADNEPRTGKVVGVSLHAIQMYNAGITTHSLNLGIK